MSDDPRNDRDELVEELRDRIRSLERRLDDERESRKRADAIIAQLTQGTEASPSVLRGSVEEGGKEITRRLVGGILGLAVYIPSATTAVISYFNDAPTLTVLSALFAFFGLVVGTYFGIKASADTAESVQRIAAEASAAAERAAQEARGKPREDG